MLDVSEERDAHTDLEYLNCKIVRAKKVTMEEENQPNFEIRPTPHAKSSPFSKGAFAGIALAVIGTIAHFAVKNSVAECSGAIGQIGQFFSSSISSQCSQSALVNDLATGAIIMGAVVFAASLTAFVFADKGFRDSSA